MFYIPTGEIFVVVIIFALHIHLLQAFDYQIEIVSVISSIEMLVNVWPGNDHDYVEE